MRQFNRRIKYGGEAFVNKHGQRYIPIHPFSDDEVILKKIKLEPEKCTSVDAYWNMGVDVCFFRVSHSSRSDIRIRWEKRKQGYLNFNATVADPTITKDVFEAVMSEIVEKQIQPSEQLRRKLSERLEGIDDYI